MDFSEQSILNEAGDETQCFGEDRASITRGHWSRMSLPPRLSYLEGFLERTRLYNEHVGGELKSESQQYEDGDILQSSSSSSCEDKVREDDVMSRSGQSSNPDYNSKENSLTQASETTAVSLVEVNALSSQASIIADGLSTDRNDSNSTANATENLTVVLRTDNIQGIPSPSSPCNKDKLSSPDNKQVNHNDNHVFILNIDNEEMFIKNEDNVTKDNNLNDNLTTGPDDMSLVDNTDDRSSVTDIDNVTDNDWDKKEYFV